MSNESGKILRRVRFLPGEFQREVSSCLERGGLFRSLFPLTPALSLGERENRFPVLRQFEALSVPRAGLRVSLSPRERAGVRGKASRLVPATFSSRWSESKVFLSC
jgi:hypothetical protein